MIEQEASLLASDILLRPFLLARSRAESDSQLTRLLTEQAEPIIKGIIRDKLKVTLSASDGRLENQDALEVQSDVLAMLLTELQELKENLASKTVNNFRSYVAVITFHACYKYLRQKHPQRGQLKDKLRYLLTNRPTFALWQSSGREWLCGFAEWRNHEQSAFRAGQLAQLISASQPPSVTGLPGVQSAQGMQLDELLPTVLSRAGKPVEFDELVNTIAELQGIKQQKEQPAYDDDARDKELAALPDQRPDAAEEFDRRSYVQKLWKEICELPLRQRAALLLNLRDPEGHAMIAMFPLTGIAAISQIAAALELSAEKFAVMWNELPWEDVMIAQFLNLTRQQVVNLRKCARERLARRMRGF